MLHISSQYIYPFTFHSHFPFSNCLSKDQTRLKFGVNKAFPLDFASECRNLHKVLAGYSELLPVNY
jgi:hypothetical protein